MITKKDFKFLMQKLKDYNCIVCCREFAGELDLDNIGITEEYFYDMLEVEGGND